MRFYHFLENNVRFYHFLEKFGKFYYEHLSFLGKILMSTDRMANSAGHDQMDDTDVPTYLDLVWSQW
jgi:hypothetical protein